MTLGEVAIGHDKTDYTLSLPSLDLVIGSRLPVIIQMIGLEHPRLSVSTKVLSAAAGRYWPFLILVSASR